MVRRRPPKVESMRFQQWQWPLNKLVSWFDGKCPNLWFVCHSGDNLQCAICMDDFKENEQAKRLPCSHHFHEKCISQWLRLVKLWLNDDETECPHSLSFLTRLDEQHGTCPTCRVTLDGDNTSNREYFTFSSGGNSSTNNNRRNDRNNPGPSSNSGSTLMDFDWIFNLQ